MIEQADYWKDLSTVLLYIQEPGIIELCTVYPQSIRSASLIPHLIMFQPFFQN